MDFVVVGFGLGALIVLVGMAARDLAPRLRRPVAPEQQSDAELGIYSIQRVPVERWTAACQNAGQAIMIGGGAIVLAAAGGIIANLDNGDGAHLVLVVTLIVIGGIALRLGMLASGLFPIDRRSRERVRQSMQRAAPKATSATESPRAPTSTVASAAASTALGSNGVLADEIPAATAADTLAMAANEAASSTGAEPEPTAASLEQPDGVSVSTDPNGAVVPEAESVPASPELAADDDERATDSPAPAPNGSHADEQVADREPPTPSVTQEDTVAHDIQSTSDVATPVRSSTDR